MTAVLSASGVSVTFGGVHALVDVDLDVAEGQLVGLIGPNGAGKTTFIDAITGFVPCRGPRRSSTAASSPRCRRTTRARRGLARTWQSIELFDDLTVRENLAVAAVPPVAVSATVQEVLSRARRTTDGGVDEALELLGLEPVRRGDAVRALPGPAQARRRRAGAGRRTARSSAWTSRPRASTRTRARSSAAACARWSTRGTSMLLVDHDMGLVLAISDYVVVLEFGKVIAQRHARRSCGATRR